MAKFRIYFCKKKYVSGSKYLLFPVTNTEDNYTLPVVFKHFFYILRKYDIKILYLYFLFIYYLTIEFSVSCISPSPMLCPKDPVLLAGVTESMEFKSIKMFRTKFH
jgi:hypothetical protein